MIQESDSSICIKTKQEALYEKSLNVFKDRHKRVWFETHHYLEKEGKDEAKHDGTQTRYTEPMQSVVICERILNSKRVAAKEVHQADFWTLLYSEGWEEGNAVRVFEGELFTWLDRALRFLEAKELILSREKYVYGNTVAYKRPTYKQKQSSHLEDTVRISYKYFTLTTENIVEELDLIVSKSEATDDYNSYGGVIVVDDDLVVPNSEIIDGHEPELMNIASRDDLNVNIHYQSASTTPALATPTPHREGVLSAGTNDGSMLGISADLPRDRSIISGAPTFAQATKLPIDTLDVSNITGVQLSDIPRDPSNRSMKTTEQIAEIPSDYRMVPVSAAVSRKEQDRNTANKVPSFVMPPIFFHDDMYLDDNRDSCNRIETVKEKLARRKVERRCERFTTENSRLKQAREMIKFQKRSRYERLINVGKIMQFGMDREMVIPENKAAKTLPFEWYVLRLLYDEILPSSAFGAKNPGALFERYNHKYFTNDLITDDLVNKGLMDELNSVYKVGNASDAQVSSRRIRNKKILAEIFNKYLGPDFLSGKKAEMDFDDQPQKISRRPQKTYGMHSQIVKSLEGSLMGSSWSIGPTREGSSEFGHGVTDSVDQSTIKDIDTNIKDMKSAGLLGGKHTKDSLGRAASPVVRATTKNTDPYQETPAECYDRITKVLELKDLSHEKINILKDLLKTDFRYLINCVLSITMSDSFRSPLLQHFHFLRDQMAHAELLSPDESPSRASVLSARSSSGTGPARVSPTLESVSMSERVKTPSDIVRDDVAAVLSKSSTASVGYKYWVVGHPRRGFRAKQLYMKEYNGPLISYTYYGAGRDIMLGPTATIVKSAFKDENPVHKKRERLNTMPGYDPYYNAKYYSAVGGFGHGIKSNLKQNSSMLVSHGPEHKCHKYGKVSRISFQVEDVSDKQSKFAGLVRSSSEFKKESNVILSEKYAIVKSAHAKFGTTRASLDLAWRPKIHASKLAVYHDMWSESLDGATEFSDRLLETMEHFVVRREVITSSYGFRTVSCITFSRPYQFKPKNYLHHDNKRYTCRTV